MQNQTMVKNNISVIRSVQLTKKRLLERELGWIKREFKDVYTLSDIDLYNAERCARLELNINFI